VSSKNICESMFSKNYDLALKIVDKEVIDLKDRNNKIDYEIIKEHLTKESAVITIKDKKYKTNIIKDKDVKEIYLFGTDITAYGKISEKYKRDEITGVCNKEGFIENFINNEKINANNSCFIINIKNFNKYNEENGRKEGNALLRAVTILFKEKFKYIYIARLFDDIFIAISNYKNIHEISDNLEEINKELKSNFEIEIEVFIYLLDKENIDKLKNDLKESIKSKEKVKKLFDKNNKIFIYDEMTQEKLNLINNALDSNNNFEFVYFFQPYVDRNEKIVGAECLLRIKDKKDNKIITPDKFIDFAEKTGLIKKIEIHMFEKLVRLSKQFDKINLSFNICPKFLGDEEFVNKILNIENNYNNLIIEITERESLRDKEKAKETIKILKSNNLLISIDDFGVEYSSLSYFHELEFDFLKIDKIFVDNIHKEEISILIQSICKIVKTKNKNIKIIAEGIEKEEQFKKLQKLGIDYFQGYYFYKPIAEIEL